MGAKSSKPHPSGRAKHDPKWYNSIFRGLKRNHSRKTSKDSRKSQTLSQSKLEQDQKKPQSTDVNLNQCPEKRNSDTSQEETCRDLHTEDIDLAKLAEHADDLDLHQSIPVPKTKNLDDAEGHSRPLVMDSLPSADSINSGKSTPRSHDEIPVGTVFAFEQHSDSELIVNTSSRKTSRESVKHEQEMTPEKKVLSGKPDLLLQLLNNTVAELLAAAVEVESFLEEDPDIPKDVSDEITAVVGGCRLLCQDKLGKQFRNICYQAKGELPLKPDELAAPTDDDLQGFWELVSITVDKTKLQMERLKKLKSNNWKEAPLKVVKKKAGRPIKATQKKPTTAQLAAQKKRDAERKARLAALRATKLAMQRNVALEENGSGDAAAGF